MHRKMTRKLHAKILQIIDDCFLFFFGLFCVSQVQSTVSSVKTVHLKIYLS